MPSLEEIVNASGGLADALAAGIADISQQQAVPFAIYNKVILPADGFVFWLRGGEFAQPGMLHFMTEREQAEDETATRITVVFTTSTEIVQLNQTNTQQLIVGQIEGRKYAFGRIGWYAPQANLWHYQGVALHPATATQLVDDPSQLDTTELIVSNSLPAWLSLQTYLPIWITWPGQRNPQIPLYPSFLLPDNIDPPFGSVHIEPGSTRAIAARPVYGPATWSSSQLTSDDVRITLYGCNNNTAFDFLNLVLDYSYNYGVIGLTNMPVIRDEKRPWPEGMTIAQKKVLDFQVTYIQSRISTLARQLIASAQATLVRNPGDVGPVVITDFLTLENGRGSWALESGNGSWEWG